MKNLDTQKWGTLYHPKAALVFYQPDEIGREFYVEYFDMDSSGSPINAHPLTDTEAKRLAKSLYSQKKKENDYLRPKGILSTNILHIDDNMDGIVLWYTKEQKRQMYFSDNLGLPNGHAKVPAMLWFANRHQLYVFALASDRRPTEKTKLHHAPFLNVYNDGKVCMGTVSIEIKQSASVEEFTEAWEGYFFNSYFSHLVGGNNPVKGNCVSLWSRLMESGEPFPKEVLKIHPQKIKNLL